MKGLRSLPALHGAPARVSTAHNVAMRSLGMLSSVSAGRLASARLIAPLPASVCIRLLRQALLAFASVLLNRASCTPALAPCLPAILALLDVPGAEPQWQALEPRQRRQHTLDAWKRLLLHTSQEQPLLVVVEDLHWIDTETQACLDTLVESLPAARLLLLVNYRPEYQHGWGSKTAYTQLRLDPLPTASVDALLQALLGNDPSLEPLKHLLMARTAGNPFFLEESVRTFMEPKFRARAPHLVSIRRATIACNWDGNIIGSPRMLGLLGAIGRCDGRPSEPRRYIDGRLVSADACGGVAKAVADV